MVAGGSAPAGAHALGAGQMKAAGSLAAPGFLAFEPHEGPEHTAESVLIQPPDEAATVRHGDLPRFFRYDHGERIRIFGNADGRAMAVPSWLDAEILSVRRENHAGGNDPIALVSTAPSCNGEFG